MKTTRREFLNSSIAGAATVAWARPALSAGHTSRVAGTVRAHSLCRHRAESLAHQRPGRDRDPRRAASWSAFFAKEPDLAARVRQAVPGREAGAQRARDPRRRGDSARRERRDPRRARAARHPGDAPRQGLHVRQAGDDDAGAARRGRAASRRRRSASSRFCIERHESQAINKAGELVKAGAIGRVLQTIGLGAAPDVAGDPAAVVLRTRAVRRRPLRPRLAPVRPVPLLHRFDPRRHRRLAGREPAIIRSIPGSRTSATSCSAATAAPATSASTGSRPTGSSTWGDGRLTILGTDGYIELRKNVDIGGRPGGGHLFVVDQKETQYVDCSDVKLPYGERLVDDVLNRTETACLAGRDVPGDGAGAAGREAGAARVSADGVSALRGGRASFVVVRARNPVYCRGSIAQAVAAARRGCDRSLFMEGLKWHLSADASFSGSRARTQPSPGSSPPAPSSWRRIRSACRLAARPGRTARCSRTFRRSLKTLADIGVTRLELCSPIGYGDDFAVARRTARRRRRSWPITA